MFIWLVFYNNILFYLTHVTHLAKSQPRSIYNEFIMIILIVVLFPSNLFRLTLLTFVWKYSKIKLLTWIILKYVFITMAIKITLTPFERR